MKLSSPVFENNGRIPAKYTCDADNVSPPLLIADPPAEAKSLALIMDDPDAPGGTWVHWVLWNVAPDAREIAENAVPFESIEGKTSFGKTSYGGPCPPSGDHHYIFKLYALDKFFTLPSTTDAAGLRQAIEGHILEKTEFTGMYSRGT